MRILLSTLLAFIMALGIAGCGGNRSRRPLVARVPQPLGPYDIRAPAGWTRLDTFTGVSPNTIPVRTFYSTDSADQYANPAINCMAIFMEARSVDAFTEENAEYLQKKNPEARIVDIGDMDFEGYRGKYLRFKSPVNGYPREILSFIIPVEGFAYMLTCAVNEGYMPEYLPVFEQVALSFRKGF